MPADKKTIFGFSKLNKRGKIKWLAENFFRDPETVMRELISYWHHNEDQQKVLDGFSENTISNFPMPFGVAPNFVVNGKTYCIPMVIEESSVVAAASSSAKYWMERGGFNARVINVLKIGQIHMSFTGTEDKLRHFFHLKNESILNECSSLMANMINRGGGVEKIELVKSEQLKNSYQILVKFKTCNSMGANFINSVLERYAEVFTNEFESAFGITESLDILMCILSNYTPECLVRVDVSCAIKDLGGFSDTMNGEQFAARFKRAVDIANADPYRATTHNKGIFNGIDAVVIATGNDFRAVEACGHAFACRNGSYQSLSKCTIEDDIFVFELTLPLAVGTVGGLTNLHPIAKRSLELLGNPGAEELMMIICSVGLAQNFAAIKSLITTGIQKGHMQMHLSNILQQLQATEKECKHCLEHFKNETISFSAVKEFLNKLRFSKYPGYLKTGVNQNT